MPTGSPRMILLLAAALSLGAQFRTSNFVVEAPTLEIARRLGDAAERFRKEKAVQWLGKEMPRWPEPCPIKAHIAMGGPGGATTFDFANGRVPRQYMDIQGPLDKLLDNILPHEVTHTVFAYHFRCPLPRWADEGGAVLSENDEERAQHDRICRSILNHDQAIPLRQLFGLREYPHTGSKVLALYAQGFSVTSYLVKAGNRKTFLQFLRDGMQGKDWDRALSKHYRHRTVEELEKAWLADLRKRKIRPAGPGCGLAGMVPPTVDLQKPIRKETTLCPVPANVQDP